MLLCNNPTNEFDETASTNTSETCKAVIKSSLLTPFEMIKSRIVCARFLKVHIQSTILCVRLLKVPILFGLFDELVIACLITHLNAKIYQDTRE